MGGDAAKRKCTPLKRLGTSGEPEEGVTPQKMAANTSNMTPSNKSLREFETPGRNSRDAPPSVTKSKISIRSEERSDSDSVLNQENLNPQT